MEFRQAVFNADKAGASGGQREPAPAKRASGEQHTILVVDDDSLVLDLTSIILTREGYKVTQADSARKAMYFMQGGEFDLVLTDLHMPDINGIALLQWIKSHDPAISVIIITGDRDAEPASSAVRHGADEYLLKPFSRDILLAAVEHCLVNRKLARQDIALPGQERRWALDVVTNAALDIREGLASVAANLKVFEAWEPARNGGQLEELQEKIRRLTELTEEHLSRVSTLYGGKKISTDKSDLKQDS